MTHSTVCLQIAVQMAVVFAKVARIDYPKAWPNLFTDLLQQLQSQNTLTIRRVYLVLHNSLKELASKRLSSDQKNFAQVSVPFASTPAKLTLQPLKGQRHVFGSWAPDIQILNMQKDGHHAGVHPDWRVVCCCVLYSL